MLLNDWIAVFSSSFTFKQTTTRAITTLAGDYPVKQQQCFHSCLKRNQRNAYVTVSHHFFSYNNDCRYNYCNCSIKSSAPKVVIFHWTTMKKRLTVDIDKKKLTEQVTENDEKQQTPTKNSMVLYLHVGPSGDCWIGESIFAAKHLQPDYVKSIPIPESLMVHKDHQNVIDLLVKCIETSNQAIQQKIYDDSAIPEFIIEHVLSSSSS